METDIYMKINIKKTASKMMKMCLVDDKKLNLTAELQFVACGLSTFVLKASTVTREVHQLFVGHPYLIIFFQIPDFLQ